MPCCQLSDAKKLSSLLEEEETEYCIRERGEKKEQKEVEDTTARSQGKRKGEMEGGIGG